MSWGIDAGAVMIVGMLWLGLLIYPLVALGRIWLYSKQQVELLKEIQRTLSIRAIR